MQLIDSIPEKLKFIILKNYENAPNLITHDHPLFRDSRVISLDKLASTKVYSMLILLVIFLFYSYIYFESLFNPVLPGGESFGLPLSTFVQVVLLSRISLAILSISL